MTLAPAGSLSLSAALGPLRPLALRYIDEGNARRAAHPDVDASPWYLAALLVQLPATALVSGMPVLHAAALVDVELVDDLLSRGADARARQVGEGGPASPWLLGASVLHYATDPSIISRLVAAGADPDAMTDNGEAPLHLACRTADVSRLAALVLAGARPVPTSEGVEPEDLLMLPGQSLSRAASCRQILASARAGFQIARVLPPGHGVDLVHRL